MENTPLPPPFLNIPGMTNFRPVADYPIGSLSANDGPRRVVRPGVIYRGSDPSQAPIESIRRLHDECGITTIFDLRSVESIRGRGGGEHLVEAFEEKCKEVGIQRHWIPVIDKEETTPYKVAQRFVSFMEDSTDGFVRVYRQFLRYGYPAFTNIILHFASLGPATNPPDGRHAVLLHCTVGNNRTGSLTAMLLYLLGVPREVIAREYALTNIGMASVIPGMQARLKARVLKAGLFDGDESAITQEMLDRMTSSREENLLAILDMIDSEWGGPEQYAREVLKLSDDDISRFKDSLSIEVP